MASPGDALAEGIEAKQVERPSVEGSSAQARWASVTVNRKASGRAVPACRLIVTNLPMEPDRVGAPLTTSGASPSSTSRKANLPSTVRGCHAGSSATTRCGCNCTRHPRRHPPIAGDTVMHMAAIHVRSDLKRQERSARCAEEHRRRPRTWQFRGLFRPVPAARPTAGAAQGGKSLSSGRFQLIFRSAGTPLGECRLKGAASFDAAP